MCAILRSIRAAWWAACLMLVFATACREQQVVRVTQIVPVTQMIPVTQIIPATKIVKVTQVVPVTQLVPGLPLEVTRVVLAAPVVEVTRVVIVEIPPPAVTEAPPPTPAPPPDRTEAPAAPAPAPTFPPPRINAALLVWYDFEGDFLTSGMVADRSGNGFDASLRGSVYAGEGLSGGQAMLLDGNGYIQTFSNPAAGRKNVTFSLWFKTEHPENNYKLASAAWWSGGPASGWIMATHMPEFWSDDTLGLYLPDLLINENYFPSGEWVHEVVSYDGQHIREYTNGQWLNDWPTTGAAIGQGQPMAVGAWPPFGFNLEGSLDEFQIFGWTLSHNEVQELYEDRR